MSVSATNSTGTSTTGTSSTNNKMNLQASDFIKMMITQLQHQDPLQPTDNKDLLAQMSQIGTLQSNTQLQTTLTQMSAQSQIGSAAALMGKSVSGLDSASNTVSGVVTGIHVVNNQANLDLDSGQSLALTQVESVGPAPSTATAH